MFFSALKKTGIDLWDELLLLGIFNIIWVLGTLPGVWLILRGSADGLLLFILLGVILIIPWPFVTFGLFYIARDVGEGKSIKFMNFFHYARQTWRPAYIWGAVNVIVITVFVINLVFYSGVTTQWASLMQIFMGGLLIVWFVLQLVALPLYPRLQEPSLKLALRNAMIVTGRHVGAILGLAVVTVILVGISLLLFPPLLFFIAIAVVAVLANRIVDEAIARELKREEEE